MNSINGRHFVWISRVYLQTRFSPHLTIVPPYDTYLAADKHRLENIQRRAARFVTKDYHRTTSVAGFLSRLEWRTLEERRRARLTLLFKMKNYLVGIDANQYLTPANPRIPGGKSNFKHIFQTNWNKDNFFQEPSETGIHSQTTSGNILN